MIIITYIYLFKVLRHYEISIPENYAPQPVLELIIKSENGVQLLIKDRIYSSDQ